MPSQVTYTGTTGPGTAVTAQITANVQSVMLDLAKQVITITRSDGAIREYSLAATTTLTCAITAGANATIVVS